MAYYNSAFGRILPKTRYMDVHLPNPGGLPYDGCRSAIDGAIDLFAERAGDDVVGGKVRCHRHSGYMENEGGCKGKAHGQGYRYGQAAEG